MITEEFYMETLNNYLKSVGKNERKIIGQFFTPTSVAEFMAGLMNYTGESITILDPGAGSGILTGAICDVILKNNNIKNIHVDLYENDKDILILLQKNMEYAEKRLFAMNKRFTYTIKNANFIVDNAPYWRDEPGVVSTQYDVIISNPPYKKIGKSAREAVEMKDIVYGQPNIYFLFMAMSAKLLKEKGQMIFIIPCSFSSGAYFQRFRQWFFDNVKISHIHLFVSREDVFNCDKILQETIILKAVKTKEDMESIIITESEDMQMFNNLKRFKVPYNIVVRDDINRFMLIPTKKEDIEIINFVNSWPETLVKLGYKLKTGPVVDFRATEFLKYEQQEKTVPLFWSYNFNGNSIKFPASNIKKPQYIISSGNSQKFLIKNKNYLFVKRFTSKEENRRIQSAIYLADEFDYDVIGIENHLNYITKINGTLSKEELYGIFVVLNSSYLDRYFRILNGSTQVNAIEMNAIPFPDLNNILEIGNIAINTGNLTVNICDKIIDDVLSRRELLNVG